MLRPIGTMFLIALAGAGCAQRSDVRAQGSAGAAAPVRTAGPVATRSPRVATASCAPQPGLAAAPLPGEIGVYRAGPLTLAIGDDLAQHPGSGSKAIAAVTGGKPIVLSIGPRSPVRAALEFTAPPNPTMPPSVANGEAAVRLPGCGPRIHRFLGGLTFAGRGCLRLRVLFAGSSPRTMLVPIGNSLRGCPVPGPALLKLTPGAITVGVSCPTRSPAACDRVGVAVRLAHPAVLITVGIGGRLVTLSPPEGRRDDTWLGYLWVAPSHLPARVRVHVTTFFANGTAAAMLDLVPLSAGFG